MNDILEHKQKKVENHQNTKAFERIFTLQTIQNPWKRNTEKAILFFPKESQRKFRQNLLKKQILVIFSALCWKDFCKTQPLCERWTLAEKKVEKLFIQYKRKRKNEITMIVGFMQKKTRFHTFPSLIDFSQRIIHFHFHKQLFQF